MFVAALLQYLFLSAFCWMMCEGIMLYLMLIVVFSKLSSKWWFFLILGWGEQVTSWCLRFLGLSLVPALIPVVVGVAVRHKQYGVRNDSGKLE